MMGPGPPKKKGDKTENKNASQRALNTAGQGSSYASSGAISITDAGSSPTAVTEGSRLSGDGWNLKRYQREDEALWGHDTHGPGQRIMDAIAKAGSTAGRLIENRLSRAGSGPVEEDNPGTYYLAKNPPVNDLHPPVVSTQPASRDETRWMLQPPPSAKVMEGKERVNRNRAGSNGSSRKGGDGTPLSRQITGRIVDARLQRGEATPSRTESLSRLPASGWSRDLRHERSRSLSTESEGSSEGGIRRKRRPPPISISTDGTGSVDKAIHIPIPSKSRKLGERPSRPVLTTVISSSTVIKTLSTANGLLALQELSNPSSNSVVNSRAPSPSNPLSRLSPSVNAMPASIPSVDSKFPGSSTFIFPPPTMETVGAGNVAWTKD
ncbi:hypothetical protein D0Z07_3922 [Hyphodiscus hymeniophilus]|uniref:Uncharacterized protein n=1 Tax=Hyphodiscus hymeniophilus TaxID=353542 RepID=A0A9P6VLD6_9HELO|nr:hypothetical protein D0Z07_3922 [Hyphodiscus hymeniophilus]